MANYKQIFMNYMDREGIRYVETGEFTVRVTYNGDNLKSIPVVVIFDEDGEAMVQMFCWEIANFKGKREKGVEACNELNNKYRWIKFYIDKDEDVVATIDAYIDAETCGRECVSLVNRFVSIVDGAYPVVMRHLYGN